MKIFTKVILIFLVVFTDFGFAQWVTTPTINGKVSSFVSGTAIYACTDNGSSGNVWKTTDGGTSWSTFAGIGSPCYSFAMKSSTSMVAGCLAGIKYYYQSSYWTLSNVTWETRTVLYDGTNYYAGTSNGVYKSTNDGASWMPVSLSTVNISCLVKSGVYMWAGCAQGLYYSTNTGNTWTLKNCPNVNAIAFENSNNNLWIGTSVNLLWSNDGGQNLTSVEQDTTYAITINGGDRFCGVKRGVKKIMTTVPGIYYTIFRNGGFPSPAPTVYSLIAGSGYLLAGTANNVWRAPYNYVTNLEKVSSEVLSTYELKQNYPNPFNPTTVIKYQLPKEGTVTLKIYDITGKELETLVNENQSPGTYEVNWNASKYSSGVYFYKIESEGFSDTKRMLLVK